MEDSDNGRSIITSDELAAEEVRRAMEAPHGHGAQVNAERQRAALRGEEENEVEEEADPFTDNEFAGESARNAIYEPGEF